MENPIEECLAIGKEIDELKHKIESDQAQANSHEKKAKELKTQMGKEMAKAKKMKTTVSLSKLSLQSLQFNKEDLRKSIGQQETVAFTSLESARLVIGFNADFKKPTRVRIAPTLSQEVADAIDVVLSESGLEIDRVPRDTSQAAANRGTVVAGASTGN